MIAKYKKIIVIVAIAIALFFIYSFFFAKSEDGELIRGTVNAPSGADVIGSEIIQALNQIETLQLDRTIFSDPVYRSLVDRSQPIPPEPAGRENPFAPISFTAGSGAVITIPQEAPAGSQSGQGQQPRAPQN